MFRQIRDVLFSAPEKHQSCPYCDFIFDQEIKRTRKCPECKNKIVVRKENGKSVFLTENEALEFDKKKKQDRTRKAYIRHFEAIEGNEKEFSQRESLLEKKYKKPPSYGDIFWSLSNEYLQNAMKKNDFDAAKSIYWHQARVLYDLEGRDPYLPLRESMHIGLKAMDNSYFPIEFLLQICGRGDCKTASEINGQKFTIDEAIKTAPIPRKDCERGFCTCVYVYTEKI